MSRRTAKIILGFITAFLILVGYLAIAHCLKHFDMGYFTAGVLCFWESGHLIYVTAHK